MQSISSLFVICNRCICYSSYFIILIEIVVRPTTSVLSGNPVVVVDGRPLIFTCTAGSSNPAASITWTHDGATFNNAAPVSETRGANNGIVMTQNLTINLTRQMDGDAYSCSASNVAGTSSKSDTFYLSLSCMLGYVY